MLLSRLASHPVEHGALFLLRWPVWSNIDDVGLRGEPRRRAARAGTTWGRHRTIPARRRRRRHPWSAAGRRHAGRHRPVPTVMTWRMAAAEARWQAPGHEAVLAVHGSFSLLNGPQLHSDGPVRLDDLVPDLGQDDVAVGAFQVVVSVADLLRDHVDVQEGLFDQFLHALPPASVTFLVTRGYGVNLLARWRIGGTGS